MPHSRRPPLAARHPVHVTLHAIAGLRSLRRSGANRVLRRAFRAGRERFGFRLVHYAVLSNHLHLVVEAEDARALSRGMQGLTIRIARALNRWWRRCGRVFAERYHARALRTPREVRHALAYVLGNARKHGIALSGVGPDPFTSGAWFDGWKAIPRALRFAGGDPPVTRARTWLLSIGWRRHGLVPLGGSDTVGGGGDVGRLSRTRSRRP